MRDGLCIISNNCWSSGFYQASNRPYNTPFVGLYIHADDYIMLLRNFRLNMGSLIEIDFESKFGTMRFPVGKLGGRIEIFFLHYESCDEALDKWTRRAGRIPRNDDQILIKICDRDGFEQMHVSQFEELDFSNKIGFLRKGRFRDFNRDIFHEINCEGEMCPSGTDLYEITKREQYVKKYLDCPTASGIEAPA